MRRQFLISFLVILFLFSGTVFVVFYGRGYRFFPGDKPELSQTGMLVATSTPNGAQVFINGHLTTATDNTISLSPGEYLVKISEDGYFPWEKKIKIQKEVVARADALLFPLAPKLNSITANGVENPIIDPSFTKLAYAVSSQSARKNGIYVLDMNNRPILTLQSASTQIADDTLDLFSKAKLSWSPDGKELIASISAISEDITTYLIKTDSFNDQPKDTTATLDSVLSLWKKDLAEKETARFQSLKSSLRNLINQNFNILSWSPDETKILYEALASATLPIIIKPRLLGVDSTPEQRTIEKNSIYIYDIKEDKNYKLNISSTCHPALRPEDDQPLADDAGSIWIPGQARNDKGCPPLTWLSDSNHLIYVHDKKIDIMEFDGTNQTTVYAGPFLDNYVFPWVNGTKIVMLTNLGNPNILPNLYTVELK